MREDQSESDRNLVRRARDGSLESFEALVTKHQDRLFNFLMKRNGHRHEAEDLLQETFVRAYRNIDKFDDSYRFDSWLYTIAVRLTINRRRSAGRAVILMEPEKISEISGGAMPADAAGEGDLWAKVRSVLDNRQFTVVWLKHVEGMSSAEVADVMGITGIYARMLLYRAHRKLQSAMERSDFAVAYGESIFVVNSTGERT